jgi:tetratricopeptide (TPR) repeat protein
MVPAAALLTVAMAASPVAEAERMAADAVRTASQRPDEAASLARRALELTAEFDPIAFVRAGRKGEVVEDAFQAARDAYRKHRAQLYEAMGTALFAGGRNDAAVRYLRRAFLLEPTPERMGGLARALLVTGRGADALTLLQSHVRPGGPSREMVPLFEQATDAAGRPSAQAEIDRARLLGLAPAPDDVRDGPLKLPPGARLSTGGPLRLEPSATVFYLASRSCRTCSEDLEALKGIAGSARVLLVSEAPNDDHPLRQIVELYHYDWPIVLGAGVASALGVSPGSLLVVGRSGWVIVPVKPPFTPMLGGVLAALARSDVTETVPRKAWDLRPPDRRPAAPLPGLLAEGLAPGEDEPGPPEFDRALEAYRGERYPEAMRLIDQVAAQGEGWLLSPEARLDRAIILGRMGRAAEARRMLLRIGDSRFQDAVDRALEGVASKR